MNDSLSTSDALLDGAMAEFARHGFAKTSMADVARASGISRTSLYNHFSTKEDVFKALSERINTRVYSAIVTALKNPGTWEEILLSVINARVSWVYELLHASEYGRELINEKNRICGGTVLSANDRFQALVRDLMARQFPSRTDTDQLANVLILSVNGVLEKAETKEGAQMSIALLLKVFCNGLK